MNERENQLTGLRIGTTIRRAVELTNEEKQEKRLKGELCPTCQGAGYKGRIGSYELLTINSRIAEAIKTSQSTEEIEQLAVEDGMMTLRAYTVALIDNQLTTIDELERISNMET